MRPAPARGTIRPSSRARAGVDPGAMLRFWISLLFLALGALAPAQDREATVELDDGKVVVGKVLAMDLHTLQLQVDGAPVAVEAARIRSCRFRPLEQVAPAAEGDPAAAAPVAAAQEPSGAIVDPPPADRSPAAGTSTAPARPRITWRGPLQDPADPEAAAQVPHDLRQSRLRGRLEALDQAYPWLAPAAPAQWFSLGLILLIGATLVVQLSVRVAGAETPSLGRCFGLGAWYLLTTILQVAGVAVTDLTVVLMLLANSSLALFWLVALFELPRLNALIAFAIQLGFVGLGWGVLELITAVLGSIGVHA